MSVSPDEIGPRAQAAHLLNRIGFGPRPGDVGRVLAMGMDRYVERQVYPDPDPETESRLRGLTTLNYPTSQVLALYNADQRSIGRILEELYTAKIIRAVHSENQLQEVLVDLWFNHFNVYILDGFARYSTMSYERDAIRPFVLGRFRDLLGATAHHPAMMFYLDNYVSTVSRYDRTGRLITGLNENYGRELLELHTVGVDAGYTQDDVFGAALAFTGWGIDNLRTSGKFMYRSFNHDTKAKHTFGLNLPAGGQKEDGDRLLDYVASHPATARHVSWRLVQRFVADDPPPSLVERCAAVFQATDGDIARVMLTIFASREFWGLESFGVKPKTPFEFVVSALRAVDAQVTNGGGAVSALNSMGMPPYAYLAPTGYSNRGTDWLNPSSHLQRMNFALDTAAGAVRGVTVSPRSLLGDRNPDDPRAVAAGFASEIFGNRMSRETFEGAARVGPGGASVLVKVVGLLLASPEFQVR